MKLKTEEAMKNSQFGFRQGRGTVDAIFIVRQIIEKAREHQVPFHFNFIDFKSAFDTVWRKALWRMMIAIGVDTKIVNIIEALYKDTECAIVIDGHITEWFKVNIGVRQACILSPTLFNIFLEFVMKELKSLDQDLQMKNTLSVDIRYADDTTLISTVFNKLKISSGELEEACRKWGMKINGGKCKIISTSTDSIKIDGKNVDHVEEFVFLSSVVPDTSADVMRRIALAASAFGRLRKVIWDRHDISNHLNICLYNALILPIATYASETWTLKSEDTRKLTVFEMRCLRSFLGTTLADRIRNTDIITRSGIRHTIIDHIKTRRLSWFGHVVRRPEDSYVYKAYKDDFTQARPRGRPPKRWSAQIREDTGLPLLTLERRALNRGRWRGDVRLVNARGYQQRCCSDNDDVITISNQVTNYFSARQYHKHIIESANKNILSIHREHILMPSSNKVSLDSIPLILPFHPSIYPLRRIILKHYKTLMTNQDTKDIFKLLPITSYKRERNLCNHLVRASEPQSHIFSDAGTFSCKRRRCNTCKFVTNCSATHIEGPKGSFNVTQPFTCISPKIVYGIICKRCNIIYIGETGR